MYSLTPEERYLEIINRCPDLLKLITLKALASSLLIRPATLRRIRSIVVQKLLLDFNQEFIYSLPLLLRANKVYCIS